MSDVNSVTIVGGLGKDPELRETKGGMKLCSFGIANGQHRKDKTTDEWIEDTSWFDVTVFGDQAVRVAEKVKKGQRVCVVGKLKKRTWEAEDGSKRSAVEIIASQVQSFEKKEKVQDDTPF